LNSASSCRVYSPIDIYWAVTAKIWEIEMVKNFRGQPAPMIFFVLLCCSFALTTTAHAASRSRIHQPSLYDFVPSNHGYDGYAANPDLGPYGSPNSGPPDPASCGGFRC
jgi:hypothetical protein